MNSYLSIVPLTLFVLVTACILLTVNMNISTGIFTVYQYASMVYINEINDCNSLVKQLHEEDTSLD